MPSEREGGFSWHSDRRCPPEHEREAIDADGCDGFRLRDGRLLSDVLAAMNAAEPQTGATNDG